MTALFQVRMLQRKADRLAALVPAVSVEERGDLREARRFVGECAAAIDAGFSDAERRLCAGVFPATLPLLSAL